MNDNKTENHQTSSNSNSLITMITFADLMALLLAFFVLLYSLSEIDRQKFKLVGNSLQFAFGNIIGPPEIHHQEFENIEKLLKNYQDPTWFYSNFFLRQDNTKNNKNTKAENNEKKLEPYTYTEKNTKILQHLFKNEINGNVLHIQQKEKGILISVSANSAFKSGSADLTPEMEMTLTKIAQLVNSIPGKIVISGHTDNVPITNKKYHSNWELASARAATFIDFLTSQYYVDKNRIHLESYADTQNIAPNDTEENKAKNRRIEIFIDQSLFYN